jgi:hypothetical protein
MSKTATPEVLESVPVLKQHLNEFCARLSTTVKRPELISGFEHFERVNGRTEGTEAEFKARYNAFITKPV